MTGIFGAIPSMVMNRLIGARILAAPLGRMYRKSASIICTFLRSNSLIWIGPILLCARPFLTWWRGGVIKGLMAFEWMLSIWFQSLMFLLMIHTFWNSQTVTRWAQLPMVRTCTNTYVRWTRRFCPSTILWQLARHPALRPPWHFNILVSIATSLKWSSSLNMLALITIHNSASGHSNILSWPI